MASATPSATKADPITLSVVRGILPLDAQKAYDAVKSIAGPLGLSGERVAYGMFTIVNANMVNGIRRVTIERGYDPRDFVLVGQRRRVSPRLPPIWASTLSCCRNSPRGFAPLARSSRM